jgi:glyoxylate reductase
MAVMAKVYVTRRIPGPGIGMIEQAGHDVIVNPDDRLLDRGELELAADGAEGLLTQLGDAVGVALLDRAGPQLRVVSNYAVGYNNIDVDAATQRSVAVCNTPGVLTEATADIAWTLVLGVARRVSEADRLARSGQWSGWTPTQLLGGDVHGKALVIVGAGRIGRAVARRAQGWEMRIIYVDRHRNELFERDFSAPMMPLDEALASGDYVSLHVPLSDETHHLIDARRLGLMKSTAYLVNTSRGPVVDERALVEALRAGAIAGAGLDVYEAEPALAEGLADCPNTLLLPHLGSATHETRAAMGRLAAENLIAVLAGRTPPYCVNSQVLAV